MSIKVHSFITYSYLVLRKTTFLFSVLNHLKNRRVSPLYYSLAPQQEKKNMIFMDGDGVCVGGGAKGERNYLDVYYTLK